MELTVVQALLIALFVAAVQSRGLGYATLTMRFSPMMTGLVVGIIMGRVPEAMVITAGIQLVYMGVIAPGGSMPSEPAVATAIAVPVALLAKMEPYEAIAIAIPVGLLGGYLYQFRFFLNTFIIRLTDKYAEELNDKGLWFSIMGLPILVSFALYVPVMFLALYYGAPFIAEFTAANASSQIFHVLSVVGGGLAAVGIALSVHVIGKKEYIVFFILAFFLAYVLKPLGVTIITYAVLGSVLAFIYVLVTRLSRD